MIKIILLIFLLTKLSIGTSLAESEFKIVLKINKRIITNFDIIKEKKYLTTLNPQISTLSEKDIMKISKESLIKEITKEDEISKYYKIDYDSPDLLELTKNIYINLNLQDENEFKDFLLQNNLSLQEVLRKLAIEASWNRLIYEIYKDKVIIDEKKIRNALDETLKNPLDQKIFFLSELLFVAENKVEFEQKHQKILQTIEEQSFKNAATIFSISNSKTSGGQLGWVRKNQLSDQISTVVKNMEKNDYSKPIKIPSGFLIIRLDDIKYETLEIDYDKELEKAFNQENNRQLNQFSNIHFKKIQRKSYIDEQ